MMISLQCQKTLFKNHHLHHHCLSFIKLQRFRYNHNDSHNNNNINNNNALLTDEDDGGDAHHRVSRHFVAIFAPTYTMDALQGLQKSLETKMIGSHIKWVPRCNLHLTLRYFGPVLSDPDNLQKANDIITEVVSRMQPFEVKLQGLGVFPKWKKPRVLYVGVTDGSGNIKALVAQLEEKWKRAGLPPQKEQRTVPHITIDKYCRDLMNFD